MFNYSTTCNPHSLRVGLLLTWKADILCNKIGGNFVSKIANEKYNTPPRIFLTDPLHGYRPWAGIETSYLYLLTSPNNYSICLQTCTADLVALTH